MLEHGSLRLMAMSAARGNAVSEFANCDGWSNSAPMSAISASRRHEAARHAGSGHESVGRRWSLPHGKLAERAMDETGRGS